MRGTQLRFAGEPDREEVLLAQVEQLREEMPAWIKELGLTLYFSGHLLNDLLIGEIMMAMKVYQTLGFDDQEISRLFSEALNVDHDRIANRYAFPSVLKDHAKEI